MSIDVDRTSDIGSQQNDIGGQGPTKMELAISELDEIADARVHVNGQESHASSPGGLAIAAKEHAKRPFRMPPSLQGSKLGPSVLVVHKA
ncbi:hypothetical protein SGCOL_000913 [Colletotrichum sp. CLE4]